MRGPRRPESSTWHLESTREGSLSDQGPPASCPAPSWVRPLRKNSKAFALMELHPESQHPGGLGGGHALGLSLSRCTSRKHRDSREASWKPHLWFRASTFGEGKSKHSWGTVWEGPTVPRTRGAHSDVYTAPVGREGRKRATLLAQTAF